MKKLFFALCALALIVTACKEPVKPIDLDVEDGVYVFGEATGFDKVDALLLMANGINEAKDQTARDGMFEKYIVLEGGKEFSLLWLNAGTQTYYGANLAEFTPAETSGIYADNPATAIYKGKLEIGESAPKMKMATTGLYHIVLDLNKNNDLSDAQILVAPVQWGVRGGMNNWGFTALEATPASNSGITYVLSGQELGNNGDFKFSYNGAWKITLDDKGEVKANTNLGTDCKPGGSNIVVTEGAGKYKVTLYFKLAGGAIENSFSYKTELQEAASYPENVYMIGAAFGGWSWEDAGVVTLQHISAGGDPKDGCFVVTRYFKADDGFKFATAKEWGKAFGGMTTNPENVTWDGDGNIHVPSDGLWTITLDYTKDEMTLTEGMIYGMGPAVNGDWTMGKYAGEINADGTATIVALSDGALRVYAPCAFDWWQHEFQPAEDGTIAYREGGELAAFNVEAGQEVTFDFNAGTVTVGAPFVGKIAIDGDFADWAGVEGVTSEGVSAAFKVTSDEKFIYFYYERTGERMADLWNGNGYVYLCFDLDNDDTTGVELWGNGPYEILCVIYPYADNAIAIAGEGTAVPEGCSVDRAKVAGAISEGVAFECSIPRADLLEMPVGPVNVWAWSNKSGTKINLQAAL